MTQIEREQQLTSEYGEVCTKTTAARILNKVPRTISRYIQAGILDSACAGSMVDVRSIARYIHQPATAMNEARLCRTKAKYSTDYAV